MVIGVAKMTTITFGGYCEQTSVRVEVCPRKFIANSEIAVFEHADCVELIDAVDHTKARKFSELSKVIPLSFKFYYCSQIALKTDNFCNECQAI